MVDTLPFLVVFLLFTSGFSFAGHWLFGFMMEEFHTWPQSFSTLFQTMGGGLPFKDMKNFAPVGASIFTIFWIIIMTMVLINMFVAILTDAHQEVTDENKKEDIKLTTKVGDSAKIGFIGGIYRYLYTRLTGKKIKEVKGSSKPVESEPPKTIYDFGDRTGEVNAALKKVDLRKTDLIRKALLKDQKVTPEDVAMLFGGDMIQTQEFVNKVNELMAGQEPVEDQEQREQERLKMLQSQVRRLENQLKALRGALHETKAAPANKGLAREGYTVHNPNAQHPAPALPGTVEYYRQSVTAIFK